MSVQLFMTISTFHVAQNTDKWNKNQFPLFLNWHRVLHISDTVWATMTVLYTQIMILHSYTCLETVVPFRDIFGYFLGPGINLILCTMLFIKILNKSRRPNQFKWFQGTVLDHAAQSKDW